MMGVPLLSEAESFPAGSNLRELPIWGLIMRTFHVFNKMFFCFLFSFLMFPPATRAQSQVLVEVVMLKDPRSRVPKVTSQIKLHVKPERAAVFVDDAFVGTVSEFTGVGHGMLVSTGKHRIKIALAGYQTFETDVSLLPRQKITIKTALLPGSITQAGSSIKQE